MLALDRQQGPPQLRRKEHVPCTAGRALELTYDPLVCSFSACFAFSIQGKTHAVCLSLLPGVFTGRMQKMLDVMALVVPVLS